MGAGLRGGPSTDWAGSEQEECEGPGLPENGNTAQAVTRQTFKGKESQRKEFGLGNELGERAECLDARPVKSDS